MKQMNKTKIRDILVEKGQKLFDAPRKFIPFTNVQEADVLLNDLTKHPHAFVLACVMDRQVKAEKAWLIPYLISEKIGEFSIGKLNSFTEPEINRLMSEPNPLHRFIDQMSGYFHKTVQRIVEEYDGDASRLWKGSPSSAEVVYRFLEFDGVGPKIGSMAANILARDFKITFEDYFYIDISADVHVRRVFSRLGLCKENATVEQVIYKARSLYPEFPGIMDWPCWELGREWCKPHNPDCHKCYLKDICPTALQDN